MTAARRQRQCSHRGGSGLAARAVSAAVALALVASLGLADPLTLSPEQARRVAWVALAKKRPHITLQIAQALARKHPDDFELVLLTAEAERALGRTAAAEAAARRAWALADTPGRRFDAAHLVAKTLHAGGKTLRAQFWLRRAEHIAPNARARALAIRDYRFIRATSPLQTRLSFAILPTSNINNGSTADTIVVNGIPFQVPASGQPHAGTGFALGVETTWRRQIAPRTFLRLGAAARGTTYRLSKSARALGSGLRGSDFATAALEVSAGVTLAPARRDGALGTTHFDLTLGRSWYGGNPLANYARLDAAQDFRLSQSWRLRGEASLERQWRLDDARASADVRGIGASAMHTLSDGSAIRFGASLRDTSSQSAIVRSRRIGAQASWHMAPFGGYVQPTLSFDLSRTSYDRFVIGGTTREDTRAIARLDLFFPRASYYGFAPTLTLSAARNRSNVSIYDTRDARLSLGIRSTF